MTSDKGFLEYLPLINLGVTITGIIAAFLILKLALAGFQTSVRELKEDFQNLETKMEKAFEAFSEKLNGLDKRIVAVETVGSILGRKPNH